MHYGPQRLTRDSLRVESWGDVVMIYVLWTVLVLSVAFLPLYHLEYDHVGPSGSTNIVEDVSLSGSSGSSSGRGEDPEGAAAESDIDAIDTDDAELSFGFALAFLLFAIPRTRWSRGLLVLAVMGWTSGLMDLRFEVARARSLVSSGVSSGTLLVEWRWGFAILVAIGFGLIALAIGSFLRPRVSAPPREPADAVNAPR